MAETGFGQTLFEFQFRWWEGDAMADMKDKIKDKIEQGAEKAKDVTEKAVDKGKDAAKKVGQTVKDAGQKIKKQGK